MGIAETALRLLLPHGAAWSLAGYGDALIRGIAKSLERARSASDAMIADAKPGTASETTLREWHAALGQRYDPTLPIATQRARLEAFRTSAGGATVARLQAQIAREYPDLVVSEPSAVGVAGACEAGVGRAGGVDGDLSTTCYDITGTVDSEADAQRVAMICNRFAPLHLLPFIKLTVRSLTTNAEAGVGVAGLAEAGSDGTAM